MSYANALQAYALPTTTHIIGHSESVADPEILKMGGGRQCISLFVIGPISQT